MQKITLTMEHDEAAEFFAFATVGIKNVLDAANAFKKQGGDVGDIDASARRAMELMKFALLTAGISDDK
jgi:hypothetical protein